MSDIPNLKMVYPEYNSNLVNVILELEKLRQRHRYFESDVHPAVFFQLKGVFHLLESIGSVRIEGNNTTISEYLDHTLDDKKLSDDEKINEISNIQTALNFIEENVQSNTVINKALILELHKIVVKDLIHDGDKTPGFFRKEPVIIKNSAHTPPHFYKVPELMDELFSFINQISDPKDQLISIALSHHRFSWIHPFSNGNGRVVRLLTYAMLIKQGFSVKNMINPTAIFCNNRNLYYDKLALADTYEKNGQLSWIEYVLSSLLKELNKIDNLLDKNYLFEKIINPALKDSLDNKYITEAEYQILKIATEKGEFKAIDIKKVFPIDKSYSVALSRGISKLKSNKMIVNIPTKERIYQPLFIDNYLTRSIIKFFRVEDFVSFGD
jgi:Fic family protein